MEEKKLLDFSINENMDIFVLIKSAEVRVAKNGKSLLPLILLINQVK